MQSTPKRVLFLCLPATTCKKKYIFLAYIKKKVVPLQRKLFKTHNYEKILIFLCHRSSSTRHGIL